MPAAENSLPIVIVGGGPIGLETAVALRRRGIPLRLIEAGTLGHTIGWWAPQTRWFSSNERIAIAGVPLVTVDQSKCTREQYLAYLRGIAEQFGLEPQCQTSVIDVARSGDHWNVRTQSRAGIESIDASAVVLAIGGTDHPRKLGIAGEDLPHVDGYLREVHQYFGRRVVIVGGRNSAIEAALRLHHVGAHVTLVHRGESLPEQSIKYWLMPELKGLIKSERIQLHLQSQPTRIHPDRVEIQSADGSVHEVPCDDVLTLIGYEQSKDLFRRIGVELVGDRQHPVFDESTMQTNLPGIYVAGTAVAGTQSSSYKTFVENCHVHVERIVNDLMARQNAAPVVGSSVDPPPATRTPSLATLIEIQPES